MRTASTFRISCKEQYPDEMTIIIQHQYWALKVKEDYFEVTLTFKKLPAPLHIPFQALTAFFDPGVQFGLQFRAEGEAAKPATGPVMVPHRRARAASRSPEAERAGQARRRRKARRSGQPGFLPQEITVRDLLHDQDPHRNRHLRPHRGRRRPLLGRAGPAHPGQFQDRLGEAAAGRSCARWASSSAPPPRPTWRWASSTRRSARPSSPPPRK